MIRQEWDSEIFVLLTLFLVKSKRIRRIKICSVCHINPADQLGVRSAILNLIFNGGKNG